MKKTLEEIAHSAALELAHRCGVAAADLDMAEVIVRQAIRDGIRASALEMNEFVQQHKTGKKNPNRFYVSE